MANPSPVSGKIGDLVRRSVEKVSGAALRFTPSDKRDDNADAALAKKEHRRAQVRKAQIEHRQRKENHIKSLEQEITTLRELIEDVENQTRLFKLENESMRGALQSASPSLLNQLPPVSTQHNSHSTYPSQDPVEGLTAPSNIEELVPLPLEQPSLFDAIASVFFDESMSVNCLQLKSGMDFGLQRESTMVTPPEGGILTELTIAKNDAGLTVRPQPIEMTSAAEIGKGHGVEQPKLISEAVYNAHRNPEIALKAINFILALEHPCRTHFVPKSATPQPNIPVEPEHLHPGHELMASTYLYAHAPLPVFQTMHAHKHAAAIQPASPTSVPAVTPWSVPCTSPTDELMKLYGMSTSLAREDWEITPVKAWFLLAERLGVDRFLGENGDRELDLLKARLGGLVQCFGFGAVLTEGLFWIEVGEVMKIYG